MNKFLKIIFLVSVFYIFPKCSKSDSAVTTVPIRDYATQYATDISDIETYLKTHSITYDTAFNVTDYPVVALGNASAIWNRADLLSRTITAGGIDYKIYYLKLSAGTGQSPCSVDQILTAYRGVVLENVSTTTVTPFDSNYNPQTFFGLENVVRGWSEIFPQFKSGTVLTNSDGTYQYSGYGAGVMFLPSALAYYSLSPSTAIPSYSSLIFSFKLLAVNRLDQDGDGIPSYLEDIRGTTVGSVPDGYLTVLDDDTDGDGKPDYVDFDDDNDNVLTKTEISYVNPLDPNHILRYYPFSGVAIDNPLTPYVDERQGVPDCALDYTTATRLRKYRDLNCH